MKMRKIRVNVLKSDIVALNRISLHHVLTIDAASAVNKDFT